MTKLLTTGEMIDTLKVGEVAECVNDHVYQGCKVMRKETGLQFESTPFVISEKTFNAKWHILSRYVPLDEAIKAYKEGKTIACCYRSFVSNEYLKQSFALNIFENERALSMYLITSGDWTIEGDNR